MSARSRRSAAGRWRCWRQGRLRCGACAEGRGDPADAVRLGAGDAFRADPRRRASLEVGRRQCTQGQECVGPYGEPECSFGFNARPCIYSGRRPRQCCGRSKCTRQERCVRDGAEFFVGPSRRFSRYCDCRGRRKCSASCSVRFRPARRCCDRRRPRRREGLRSCAGPVERGVGPRQPSSEDGRRIAARGRHRARQDQGPASSARQRPGVV
jgi:hypothetical protein